MSDVSEEPPQEPAVPQLPGWATPAAAPSPVGPSVPATGDWGAPPPSFTYPPPTDPPPPPKKSKKKFVVLGVVALVAILAAGLFVAGNSGSDKLAIHGTYELFDLGDDPSITGGAANCQGTGGYSDVSAGTSIKVEDGDGKVVGSGTLENYDSTEALLSDVNGDPNASSSTISEDEFSTLAEHVCVLHFDIDVPQADFYVLKVSHRSDVTYSYKELADKKFVITLTLGT